MQLNKAVIKAILVVSVLVLMVSGCAQKTIKPDMFSSGDANSANISLEVSVDTISYNADQAVELALAYCQQGAYEKGASLFDQAADMYSISGDHDKQRKVVIAAAKTHLKVSDRKAFLISAVRLKGLIGRYEMPSEDEQLLLNLAAHMQNQDLPYPLKPEWRVIFNQ